jgi:hypothetical protein
MEEGKGAWLPEEQSEEAAAAKLTCVWLCGASIDKDKVWFLYLWERGYQTRIKKGEKVIIKK